MKIIIAGAGNMGGKLARRLTEENHDITLIDLDPAVLEETGRHNDILCMSGNCAAMDTLRKAGVSDADLLIAATQSDETNLLCCMTARGMNPGIHTISRIRTPEYSETVTHLKSSEALTHAVNPDLYTAREIASLLKYPALKSREKFARSRLNLISLKIPEKNPLDGRTTRQISSMTEDPLLIAIVVRDGNVRIPGGNFTVHSGDRIYLSIPDNRVPKILKDIGLSAPVPHRILIAGGGPITYYLAKDLLRRPVDLKIIESDEERCRQLAFDLPHAEIVHGNVRDRAFLHEEGFSGYDAVICLTGEDEVNIVLGLYARTHNIGEIYIEQSSIDNFRILNELDLGTLISPLSLTSDVVLYYVRWIQSQQDAAVTIHTIADGNAESVEFVVSESTPYTDTPLKDIPFRRNLLITAILHNEELILADGHSCYHDGDHIIVITLSGDVRKIEDLFADKEHLILRLKK